MASVNKAIIVGHLGADPELKSVSGHSVCELSIATSEKSKDGKEHTEWHRVKAWGKTAENAAQYLKKGRQVYVEGRIRTRQWEKDGQKRYTTEIIADRLTFLGRSDDGGRGAESASSDAAPEADIPF